MESDADLMDLEFKGNYFFLILVSGLLGATSDEACIARTDLRSSIFTSGHSSTLTKRHHVKIKKKQQFRANPVYINVAW